VRPRNTAPAPGPEIILPHGPRGHFSVLSSEIVGLQRVVLRDCWALYRLCAVIGVHIHGKNAGSIRVVQAEF
jgi:hypothetical protein